MPPSSSNNDFAIVCYLHILFYFECPQNPSYITYTRQGDYLLPDLTMPEQPELSMGRYARMRKKFLKEHHKVRYYNLLTSCALNEHLNDTERRANEMEQMLTEQMAASEGVTENLKATDMMNWVRKMNSIRNRVQEIVMAEVIFA